MIRPSSGQVPLAIYPTPGDPKRYIAFDGLILDAINVPDSAGCAAHSILLNGTAFPDHLTFINLTIQNTLMNAIFGPGPFAEIRHNKIIGPGRPPAVCSGGGLPGNHAVYLSDPNVIIDSNEFANWSLGYGIHFYSTQPTANNSIVSNNYFHHGDAAVLLGVGQNKQAFNNLIVHNNGTGILLGFSGNSSKVYNNTIVGNGGACIMIANSTWDDGSGLEVVKNNICYQNGSDNIVDGSGTGTVQLNNNLIGIDPKFVNSAADDFRLQSGSRAIDAGTSDIAPGITIPFNGSAPDIGAFQY